jgi:small subunit ribosomal protein S25e
MGGVKRRPLSAIEKAQRRQAEEAAKKKKESSMAKAKSSPHVLPTISDEEVVRQLAPLKAITVYTVARAFNIKASVANQLIRNLIQKGKVERVGGFSGHYVYKIREG